MREIVSGIGRTVVVLFRMREHIIFYFSDTQLFEELHGRYEVIVSVL
jgi:hypothetical protein